MHFRRHNPDDDLLRIHTRVTVVGFLVCLLFFFCLHPLLRGAAPLSGASIGNQASASYTDSTNTPHTATSNVVLTVVQQVASLSIASDQSKSGSAGGHVVFPHTVTNSGNGSDTFTLAITQSSSDNFDLTNVAIYADANGDGLPDNSTPITSTGLIAPGAKFQFVVVGIVPSTQTASQSAQLSIAATSVFDPTRTATNNDTVTVTSNAVVRATIAVSPSSGPANSGPYTYTITFTNTGNVAASNLVLTDAIPSGLTYIAGSAKWSGSTSSLTDAAGGDPTGISYDYGITTAGQLTATIANLAAGQSGTLTFQANIAANTPAGTIPDSASFSYNDGSANTATFTTNTAILTVTAAPSVTIVGSAVNSAPQGSTVSFTNVVTNTSSSTETYEISLSGSTFPTGTTFRLVKSDGVTAMLDSNSNGTVDTGPLAANAQFTVILLATLPPGFAGGPYTVNKTATSASTPTVSATAADTLTSVTASTVDITADAAATLGVGAGPEGSAVVTLSGNPGDTVRFTLNIKNTSTVSDTYNLDVSSVSNFSSLGLPTGWTVVYHNASGAVITKTDALAAGTNQIVYADVTQPAGETPGTQQVYFRAQSSVTGAVDRLHDAVATNTVRKLAIAPNNSGQIFPNGTVVYSNTLTNLGNVLEGDNVVSTVALATSNNLAGWTSTVYYDANGNGSIDAGEPIVTDASFVSNGAAGLAPGESVRLLVKVYATPEAVAGSTDVTTLSATAANGTYITVVPTVTTATDASTVVMSELRLLKEQALDANGDGVADTTYSTANITTGAAPGSCIRYRITVTNTGSQNALSVVVSDVTPTFTTYHATVPAATSVGTVASTPASGGTGTITVNVGTLAPNASAVVTYGVQINQ